MVRGGGEMSKGSRLAIMFADRTIEEGIVKKISLRARYVLYMERDGRTGKATEEFKRNREDKRVAAYNQFCA